MENSFALLVPLLVIVAIFATRNVFVSLVIGLLGGSLFVNLSNPLEIPSHLFHRFYSIFITDQGFEWGKAYILGFLITLGILGEFFLHSGGIGTFGSWARQKIKSSKQSEFVLFFLGIIIFIDGCFNAVILGQIARSLGELYHTSKERLAYIVDSTSSPVCVLVPISSWGATILAILQANLAPNQNAFLVLTQSIGFNFYAWMTLICVGIVIAWQVDAPMQKYMIPNHIDEATKLTKKAISPWAFFVPFTVLFVSVFGILIVDGYQKVGSLHWMQIFSQANVNLSLFFGGLAGLISLIFLTRRVIKHQSYREILKRGIGSMMPAIGVLILAWALAPILKDDLQIGLILAHLFENQTNLQSSLILPICLFVLSMLISFSTGTSWGCFIMMLPIGIELAQIGGCDVALTVASVLGGALYGDHTSPISDTTILSSASTRCLLQNHFVTQMFYAGICAFCAVIAFLVYGWSGSLVGAFLSSIVLLGGVLYGVKKRAI